MSGKKKFLVKCVFNSSVSDEVLYSVKKLIIAGINNYILDINSYILDNEINCYPILNEFKNNKGFWMFVNNECYNILLSQKRLFTSFILGFFSDKNNTIFPDLIPSCNVKVRLYFFSPKISHELEYYYECIKKKKK